MIVIKNYPCLKSRVDISYNPMLDFILGLDLLSKPEHHPSHLSWSRDVLNSLSRRDRIALKEGVELFRDYILIDNYLKKFESSEEFPIDEFDSYITNINNWSCDFDPPLKFLSYMWLTYIKPVIKSHETAILEKIQESSRTLKDQGFMTLVTSINSRIKCSRDLLKIDKWVELNIDGEEIERFIINPTVFAFPHLTMDWVNKTRRFYLGMDVTFNGDDKIAKGIDKISTGAFALSDKSRLRILSMLANKPMTQKEIAKEMGFAKSTTSRHINILIDSGILISQGERNTLLTIDRRAIDSISRELLELLK